VKDGLLGFELRRSLRTKLLIAFIRNRDALGLRWVIGLLSLREADQRRTKSLACSKDRGISADAARCASTALWRIHSSRLSNETTLAGALRQINPFGYDLDRVSFVAKDEVALLDQVREEYARFIAVVSHIVDHPQRTSGGGQTERTRGTRPLADK